MPKKPPELFGATDWEEVGFWSLAFFAVFLDGVALTLLTLKLIGAC